MQIHVEHNHNTKGAGMKRMKQKGARKFVPPLRVTTDDVLECAKTFGDKTWTTRDIAVRMNKLDQEYSIRTAVHWLQERKMVEAQREQERRYTAQTHCPYMVTTYKVVEKGGAPDLAALEMALGFCRAFIPGGQA